MGGGKRLNGLEEEKNVNSEGEKDIRYFKKIYVIESLEIETKMYKKADHFSCHFSHFLVLTCLHCYKSYLTVFKLFKYTEA